MGRNVNGCHPSHPLCRNPESVYSSDPLVLTRKAEREDASDEHDAAVPDPCGAARRAGVFCALAPHDGARRRPYEQLRRRVKWPHQNRSWLAERLETDLDDPKLDLWAIRTALAGKLCVYVTRA